jgi:hypothetical protein
MKILLVLLMFFSCSNDRLVSQDSICMGNGMFKGVCGYYEEDNTEPTTGCDSWVVLDFPKTGLESVCVYKTDIVKK